MPILTDAPDTARPLLPPHAAWRDAAAPDLPEEVAEAWAALGTGRPAWWAPDGVDRFVVVVDEAPRSQFDALNERLAEGRFVPVGVVCVACTGARFHGQRGRPWAALRGNLHVSVHLPLDVDAAATQAGLAALPAVAIARAIERATDGRVAPRLKWINDVLVDDRKLAGVLVATQLQGGRVRHAVVGVGANVAQTPTLAPSPRAAVPTSLADVDPRGFGARDVRAWTALLPPLLDELEHGRALLQAGRGAELVDAYRERAAFLGRAVTLWPVDETAPGPLARGRVEALLPDLSLRLEGRAEPVRSGRMTLDPPDAPPPPHCGRATLRARTPCAVRSSGTTSGARSAAPTSSYAPPGRRPWTRPPSGSSPSTPSRQSSCCSRVSPARSGCCPSSFPSLPRRRPRSRPPRPLRRRARPRPSPSTPRPSPPSRSP